MFVTAEHLLCCIEMRPALCDSGVDGPKGWQCNSTCLLRCLLSMSMHAWLRRRCAQAPPHALAASQLSLAAHGRPLQQWQVCSGCSAARLSCWGSSPWAHQRGDIIIWVACRTVGAAQWRLPKTGKAHGGTAPVQTGVQSSSPSVPGASVLVPKHVDSVPKHATQSACVRPGDLSRNSTPPALHEVPPSYWTALPLFLGSLDKSAEQYRV